MLFTKNVIFNFNRNKFNGAYNIKFQYFLNDNVENKTQSVTNEFESRFSTQGCRIIKVKVIYSTEI